jgi:RimJ/RimL family protein N-acetyltransferase
VRIDRAVLINHEAKMADTIIETDRLKLRTWEEADLAPFAEYCNTPAVLRWTGNLQDEAAIRAGFDRVSACQAQYGHCLWIIERKMDHALLGFCGLKRVTDEASDLIGNFEIGWRLREDAWGQGYAREAATASLDAAFAKFGAPHVIAFTVIQNKASWGLMERLGMTRRADLDFFDPNYSAELNPTIVYRIDAADWSTT